MAKFRRIIFISVIFMLNSIYSVAQVNAVVFGKNKIQHGNKKWNFLQSSRFNVFFYDNGEEIAKFVLQSAEKELTNIQAEAESKTANEALDKKSNEKVKIIKEKGLVVKQFIDREVVKYDTKFMPGGECAIPEPVIKSHNAAAKNETLK
jgi:hypothetical protein